MLSNVSYDLFLNLTADSDLYEGRVKVSFAISNDKSTKTDLKELFLDFHGHSVFEMNINGMRVPLSHIAFSKHRISIPSLYLNPHSLNTVTFKF